MTEKKTDRDDPSKDPKTICPVLSAMIEQGSLKPNAKGEVELQHVGAALASQMGVSKPMSMLAAYAIGPAGNRIRDILPNLLKMSFNPTAMSGGLIHHDGDTDIVSHGKFDEAAFQALVAHSSDGTSLSIADLGGAVHDNKTRDGTLDAKTRGTAMGLVELSALINILGYVDDKGTRRIGIETLRNVYEKKQLPPQAQMTSRPKTGLIDFMGTLASMAWAMARGGGSGTARAGVASAEAQPALKIEDAIVGAGAAMCPYLGAETGLRPMSVDEVAQHHEAQPSHRDPAVA